MMDMKEQLQKIKNTMVESEMSVNNMDVNNKENKENKIDSKVERKENKINSANKTNYNKDTIEMDIKRGDNLYIQLDNNGVGSEQSGTRYGICIQNDVANKYSPTIIVAFVTSRLTKAKLPIHVEIKGGNFGFPKDSVVLVEQIRTIDKKRIIKKVGHVDSLTMNRIDNAIDISVKTLKAKSLLERLPSDMKNYVITTLKQIKKLEITTEEMKESEIEKDVIKVIVDKKLLILNNFIKYCGQHQLDYKSFYTINEGVNKEVLL